jgi:hypothetical protein
MLFICLRTVSKSCPLAILLIRFRACVVGFYSRTGVAGIELVGKFRIEI